MPAPANDNWADAIVVTPLDFPSNTTKTVTGTNVDATYEDFLEYYGWGYTVYWKWTPTTSGHVVADTTAGANTVVIAILVGSGPTSFSQIAFDYSGIVEWDFVAGTTYMIQLDSWPDEFVQGAVQIDFTISGWTDPPPPTEYDVGECPTNVSYVSKGASSTETYPNSGGSTLYSDGYFESWNPAGDPGDLFLIVVISTNTGLGAPSGYTSVLNTTFDNAPYHTLPPPTHPSTGPYHYPTMQVIVAYKILTSTVTVDSAGPVFSGLEYDPRGQPNSDSHYQHGAARIYRYKCEDWDGNPVDWPSTPVKSGGLSSADAYLISDGGTEGGGSPSTATTVGWPSAVADHVGNHIWQSLYLVHGNCGTLLSSDDSLPDSPRNNIDTGFSGGPGERYDGVSCVSSITGTSVYSGSPEMATTYSGGNAYIYSGDTWLDQISPPGTTYSIVPGLAAATILIQGPEVEYQPNDDQANAWSIPECPIIINECTFNSTLEGGESDPESASIDRTVWFKYVAPTTETIQLFTDDSFYDTVLAIYDSGLSLIDSDNDSGPGNYSYLSVAVTAGETYWIQAAGDNGDFGKLRLYIDCTGEFILPYWGIHAEAM